MVASKKRVAYLAARRPQCRLSCLLSQNYKTFIPLRPNWILTGFLIAYNLSFSLPHLLIKPTLAYGQSQKEKSTPLFTFHLAWILTQ
jgi:hypothetical protein